MTSQKIVDDDCVFYSELGLELVGFIRQQRTIDFITRSWLRRDGGVHYPVR